jgi:hypothetical protein
MLQNLKNVLIHPVFIYIVIAMLECIKYDNHAIIQNEMPNVGDNFRTINNQTVYYFSGKGKYSYSSIDCYFSYENPPFELSAKEGGIKTINSSIADKIPLLGSMCDNQKVKTERINKYSPIKKYFSTNFLLDNFSNIAHLLSYFILALSLLLYLKSTKNNYWIAFGFCFIGGGLLEFIQKFFIMGRTASFEDQLLNCTGAILGITLYWIFKKSKERKIA